MFIEIETKREVYFGIKIKSMHSFFIILIFHELCEDPSHNLCNLLSTYYIPNTLTTAPSLIT